MRETTLRPLATLALAAVVGCGGAGPAGPQGGAAPSSEVAARVGDRTLTLDEVDAKARQMSMQAYQALHDARKAALEELISEQLIETEAAARGITREALVQQEVNAKIVNPDAEQVRAFYEQNRPSMRGRPLEEMSSAIRNHLAGQSREQAMGALLASLRTKYGVDVSLEPPRVPVTIAANDPTKGPDTAPVRIVEFSDFQ
jgi:hypothetical protein